MTCSSFCVYPCPEQTEEDGERQHNGKKQLGRMMKAGGGAEMTPEIHHQDVIQIDVQGTIAAEVAPEGSAESSGTGKTKHKEKQGTVDGADHTVAIAEVSPGFEQYILCRCQQNKQKDGKHAPAPPYKRSLGTAHPGSQKQKGKGHGEKIAVDIQGEFFKRKVTAEQQGYRKKQGKQTDAGIRKPEAHAEPEQKKGLHIGGEIPQDAVVGIGQKQHGPEIAGKEEAHIADGAVVLVGKKPAVGIVIGQINQGGQHRDAKDMPQGAPQLRTGRSAVGKKEIAGNHVKEGNRQTGERDEIGFAIEIGMNQHHRYGAKGL